MRVKRTANAGVLLELDGARILLDGVCGEIKPYLPTPETEALLFAKADSLEKIIFLLKWLEK